MYPSRRRRRRRGRAARSHDAQLVLHAALDLDGGRQGRCAGSSPTATASPQGEVLVEVETDKATIEVEAPVPASSRIVAAEGAIVPVDGVLGGARAERQPRRGRRRADDAGRNGGRATSSRRTAPGGPPRRRGADRLACCPPARARARRRPRRPSRAAGPGGRIVARDLATAAGRLPPGGRAPDGDRLRRGGRREHHRELAADPARPHRRRARGRRPRVGARERSPLRAGRSTVTDLLVVALARALAEVPELNALPAGRRHGRALRRGPSLARRRHRPTASSRPCCAMSAPARSTSSRRSARASSRPRAPAPLDGRRSRRGDVHALEPRRLSRSTSSRPSSPGPRSRWSRPAGSPRSRSPRTGSIGVRPRMWVERRDRPSRGRRRGRRTAARRSRAPDRIASRRLRMTIAPVPVDEAVPGATARRTRRRSARSRCTAR